jgi:predicted RNA-binding protein YlxR (DUF448 family)/ribosomal protein L7Ae-like RNA K-turn-binding protein
MMVQGRQSPEPDASARERNAERPDDGRGRTCVGCGKKVDPRDLGVPVARIVLGPSTSESAREIAVDPAVGATSGRGAHVHATASCVSTAAQRGLQRSFKSALAIDGAKVTAGVLARAIADTETRRVSGMIAAAVRGKKAMVGAEPVRSAIRNDAARLVIVATDAQAAADLTEVRRMVAEGKAVAWGSKTSLGELTGGSIAGGGGMVGVIAILDRELASAIRRSVMIASDLEALAAKSPAPPSRESSATDRRAKDKMANEEDDGRADRDATIPSDGGRAGGVSA